MDLLLYPRKSKLNKQKHFNKFLDGGHLIICMAASKYIPYCVLRFKLDFFFPLYVCRHIHFWFRHCHSAHV